MIRPLSRAEVRSIDRRAAEEFALPTLILMENAGRGAADRLCDLAGAGARIVVLAGTGNNGGDGGVVARHLDASGLAVRIVWFGRLETLTADAATQHEILKRSGVAQEDWDGPIAHERLDALLAGADWIVDGLLGTGLTRPVEGPLRDVIEAVNRSGKPVLALDLPSGLDADTGMPRGLAVRARETLTFVAPKIGFGCPGARDYTGAVHVVGIGVPRRLLEPFGDPISG
jgi:NAD(P)H-hydrate epimerase